MRKQRQKREHHLKQALQNQKTNRKQEQQNQKERIRTAITH